MNTHLTMIGHRPVLRFQRHLSHPPEKVWKAITDPAEMAHWFPATVHTELSIGAAMKFDFDNAIDQGQDYADGHILELDPPKVYAFRWVDSVLRFELIPEATGCLLLFSHTLNGIDTTGDLPSVARQASGWDHCLDLLQGQLDGTPTEHDANWFLERAEHYIDTFGLAEGSISYTDHGFVLRFERDLVSSPETVWAQLTEDDPPRTNQSPPVRFTHGSLTPGTTTHIEPAHTLEYTWQHREQPAGTVRFELKKQQPIGCRLVVTHTGPSELSDQQATLLAAWHTHLELLFAALHGDLRCPWPGHRTEQLRQRYDQRLTQQRDDTETLRTEDGHPVLRFRRHLTHPPTTVWTALTDPEQLSQWYPFPVRDMDLRIGGTLTFDDQHGTIYRGVITELDPPHVFAFREENDLLRIELCPQGDGCVLSFSHTFDDRSYTVNTAAGWHRSLEALLSLLDGRTPEWPDNGPQLQALYTEKFGLNNSSAT